MKFSSSTNTFLSWSFVGLIAIMNPFGRHMIQTSNRVLQRGTKPTQSQYQRQVSRTILPVASAFAHTTTSTISSGSSRTPFLVKQQPFPKFGSSTALNMSTSSKLRGGDISKDVVSWTYDKPCDTMEWTTFVGERIKFECSSDASVVEDSDVIILGIQGPPKSKDDETSDKDDEEKELDPIVLEGQAKVVNDKFGGLLSEIANEHSKTFKNGSVLGTTTPVVRASTTDGKIQKIILMGLGPAKSDDDDESDFKEDKPNTSGMKIGSAIAKLLKEEKTTKQATVVMPSAFDTNYADVSSSFYSDLYLDVRFMGLKKNSKLPAEDLSNVSLLIEGDSSVEEINASLEQGAMLAQGIYMTKDIVNAPHNVLNSLSLVNTARRIAKECGLQVQILSKKDCEARNMGAFLAVARGSETEPYLIHLTYKPPKSGDIKKKVGLIGKGLLFDTGGYNIKTQMMECMKFDCGGAAAVLGAARATGLLQPDGVEAHFVVAACENMISQKAYVPSDILTASNGKTIEVMNTDAEGRLTLADALVFVDKELECETIVELSTLTGACMVSLGQQVAGVWTSSDDLATQLETSSKATNDKVWRMPLVEEYKEQLKSKFADMKNLGGRYGGAITAALFLQEFVSEKKPFAHVDIAGPVWADAIGATGYGCRLVTHWIETQGQEEESNEEK